MMRFGRRWMCEQKDMAIVKDRVRDIISPAVNRPRPCGAMIGMLIQLPVDMYSFALLRAARAPEMCWHSTPSRLMYPDDLHQHNRFGDLAGARTSSTLSL
jgi:hypothetical protein